VYEPFLAALRNLVLHGRHPVSFGATAASLIATQRNRHAEPERTEAPIESLVMVGLSLGGRLGPGRGPCVTPADGEAFRQIKKRQCDVPEVLRAVCRDEAVREAWIWNTCRRFELYGWFRATADETQRADVIAVIRRELSDPDGPDPGAALNVLHGADAWHHLMRTAAGLNSGLPGEREVLHQLQAAHRLAGRAGTAGPLTEHLMAEVSEHERRLRAQTEWGRFTPSYCHAAITGIAPSLGLTLLHRGHGHDGHLKMLRKAIGSGRRRRVHKYSEKLVIDAIADADAVFIGLDRREPVLDARRIRTCRDFTARPLAIVDFNLFGSTLGLEELDGVRVWTADELDDSAATFATDMCGSAEFAQAAQAAESWIRDRIPAPVAT
jgi:glutamyl-tRNA reductase